jgi:hypothetical protein
VVNARWPEGAPARVLSSSHPDEDASGLSAMSLMLAMTFGASALLLALAAVPPRWNRRLHYPARLTRVRGGMAILGAIIFLESGLAALLLAL